MFQLDSMSLGAPYSRSLNQLVNSMVRDGYLIVVAAGKTNTSFGSWFQIGCAQGMMIDQLASSPHPLQTPSR